MSQVLLITADKPLPLCDRSEERTKTVNVEGKEFTISFPSGFRVMEHSYYRHCTDELGYPFKPCQYEMDLFRDETDLKNLKDYLAANFEAGECVDLWHVCISDMEYRRCPPRRSGTLEEFNMEAMDILLGNAFEEEAWLSITI